jgi:hypothetical protein
MLANLWINPGISLLRDSTVTDCNLHDTQA